MMFSSENNSADKITETTSADDMIIKNKNLMFKRFVFCGNY